MTFAYMLVAHYEDKYQSEQQDQSYGTEGRGEELNLTDKKNVQEMDDICDDFYALESTWETCKRWRRLAWRQTRRRGPSCLQTSPRLWRTATCATYSERLRT